MIFYESNRVVTTATEFSTSYGYEFGRFGGLGNLTNAGGLQA